MRMEHVGEWEGSLDFLFFSFHHVPLPVVTRGGLCYPSDCKHNTRCPCVCYRIPSSPRHQPDHHQQLTVPRVRRASAPRYRHATSTRTPLGLSARVALKRLTFVSQGSCCTPEVPQERGSASRNGTARGRRTAPSTRCRGRAPR